MVVRLLAIIVLCACLLGGGQAWGATFGNNTGTTYNVSIEGAIVGTQFTLSEAGVAESITAYLTVGTVANNVRCMLYHGEDSSLIAATELKTVPVQTATATTFNFNYTVNLPAGNYFIVAWGTTTAGTCILGRLFGGTGDQSLTDTEAMTSYPPDPYVANSYNTFLYRIFCTYTPGYQKILGDTIKNSSITSIKENIIGRITTTPASAISVTALNAYVQLSSAAAEEDTLRCLIYKQSDLSYVDTTYQIKFDGDTAVSGALQMWRKFTFPTAVTLSASTDYVFCLHAGHFSSSASAAIHNSAGPGIETDDAQPFDTSPPNPLQDATLANRSMSIYADYTVIASGVKPRRRKIINGLGLVREATETFAGDKTNEVAP